MQKNKFCTPAPKTHPRRGEQRHSPHRQRTTTHTTRLFLGPLMEDFAKFKDNMDAWVKQIRREVSELTDMPAFVQENTENIQHNYELIHEMRDQIEELKQEINALKLIQIISMKKADELPANVKLN